MTLDRLAQALYEQYRRAIYRQAEHWKGFDRSRIPPWQLLSPARKLGWVAAAREARELLVPSPARPREEVLRELAVQGRIRLRVE